MRAGDYRSGLHDLRRQGALRRVLDGRDVSVDNHVLRALDLSPDVDLLTRFLDRAVTATHEADLVAGEPIRGHD